MGRIPASFYFFQLLPHVWLSETKTFFIWKTSAGIMCPGESMLPAGLLKILSHFYLSACGYGCDSGVLCNPTVHYTQSVFPFCLVPVVPTGISSLPFCIPPINCLSCCFFRFFFPLSCQIISQIYNFGISKRPEHVFRYFGRFCGQGQIFYLLGFPSHV